MDSTIHINKHLTNAELQNIEKLGSPDNPVRFAIVGDISADGKLAVDAASGIMLGKK